MNCRECQQKLPSYLAGEIDRFSAKKLREHCGSCERCSQLLDEEQALNNVLDEFDLSIPDIDVSSSVMSAVINSMSNSAIRTPTAKPVRAKPFSLVQDLLAAAAAAIIVFSGANVAADNLEGPNYNSAINRISGGIGLVTSAYFQVSSNAVNDIFSTLENIKIFNEGDDLK